MRTSFIRSCFAVLLAWSGSVWALTPEDAKGLAIGDSETRIAALNQVIAAGDTSARPFLQKLLDDGVKIAGEQVFAITDSGSAADPVTGAAVELPADAEDVINNNRMRGELEAAIAFLNLHDSDRNVRLEAAHALQEAEADDARLPPIERAIAEEKDAEIRELLEQVRANIQLQSPDKAKRLAAVTTLSGSSNPNVKLLLSTRLAADGETDPEVRTAIEKAIQAIDRSLKGYEYAGLAFTGISLGSILLLAALGLAITYGLMGVINMAHGEMMMLGAYATFVVQNLFRLYLPEYFDWYIAAAIPAAFIATGLIGMGLERTVLRHLYGRPLESLLATWGISLVLMQLVRTLFGAQNVGVENPAWMSGGIAISANLVLPYNRIAIIVFSAIVLLLMWLLLTKTRMGLFVRAVTQNRAMASCVGVHTGRVDTRAFGLGSGVAGLAGVALSQIGNVGPDLGKSYIVDSFLVVVLGGVGQLAGAVYAALGLGIFSKFLEGFAGAVLAKIILLVFIIIFIQKRPQGLFALKGRSTDSNDGMGIAWQPAFLRVLGRRQWTGFAVALCVICIVFPLLNLAVPESNPLHLSDYTVSLMGKILCYAMVALAMDLVWGYTGILSLGHGLFFALGGYAFGMYLMRQIGRDGNYQSDLPDFMVFLDWKDYPWFWAFTDHFWYSALLVVLVPGVLAFVIGYFAFRSRIKGVYLSIITQALTYAFMLLFFRNETGFGGNNGFTDFKRILGFPIATGEMRMALFVISGLTLIGFLLLARYIVYSKYGRVLTAIRDAESRVMFSGYNPLYYKLGIWTLSAVMCGIAGALYVPQVGIINPSEMSPANSIEIAIWTAVGGRGTLLGPLLGAGIVSGAKSWFTVAFPEYWLYFLGLLFILVTLFLPQGVMGLLGKVKGKSS